MKKISLKDVKKALKRDEMRVIMGGSGSCQSSPGCSSGCSDGWYCDRCWSCYKP